ncbi:hypothetical protein C8R45DRAFT_1111514 [Mycena sanguinolenta]|nr:hypothetical protein C8R45DRAFT_1111514 [Mycena sanguinolenta]
MPHSAGGDAAAAAAPAPTNLKGTGERDEVSIAGLKRAHVERFDALGFRIDVLRCLNYRGANVAQIHGDRIVEEPLK